MTASILLFLLSLPKVNLRLDSLQFSLPRLETTYEEESSFNVLHDDEYETETPKTSKARETNVYIVW